MAFQGIDFRDLWRKGSGLTLRRLGVLLRALPYGSPLHLALEQEREAARKPTPELIRQRQEHYARLAREQAKEAD